MSEGIHVDPAGTSPRGKRKIVLIAAGTAVAVLAAGVAIQVFRAPDGAADERRSASDDAGRAKVATERTLARVNGRLITWDMVAEECMARYARDVLDNMVNRTIIQHACEERGIVVTRTEVEQEINRIAKRFNLAIDQWYQMLQAERDLTPEQYQRDIIWPMLALKKLAGDTVEVTDADLDRAFKRDYGARVEAKLILLDNFRRAETVWTEAQQNPEDFERLAQQHSIDPTSRALGGDIPPIRMHSGNDTLERAAFKLRKGEISPVIQVGQGRFAILRCEGRTEPVVAGIEEVREPLFAQLQEEKTQEAVAKVFEKLKTEARVDNFLTGVTTGGAQQVSGTQARSAVRTADGTRPATPPQGSAPPRRN